MIVKQPDQKFAAAPEGTFPGVCVDEIDLGKVKSSFGGDERERNMVRLVFQIDEEMDSETAQKFNMPVGSRYLVKQDYTASLDEKAKLRKHLQSWRGRAFTTLELGGFDLENVVGVPCLISIVNVTGKKGGTFSNVEAVMKPPKGMDGMKPQGYVRVKDRPAAPALVSQPTRKPLPPEQQPPDWDHGISDDDVPF